MLNTQPNLQACDDFYEALIAAHQGLSTPESHAMNARLVLLLANHIGDQATLQHALHTAYFFGRASRARGQEGWVDYRASYFSEMPQLI